MSGQRPFRWERSGGALHGARGSIAGRQAALQRYERGPLQGTSRSQCPFGLRQAGDTTGLKEGEKRPKITFENKGLMNAISFVRETKSDIDWL